MTDMLASVASPAPAPLQARVLRGYATLDFALTRDDLKIRADRAEAIRTRRLREDARRPASVNLAETIELSNKLLLVEGIAHKDR
jgi:hypothetical protein